MSDIQEWRAAAANGHTMIYRVLGFEEDGFPRLSQHDAVHDNENCPCVRLADNGSGEEPEPLPDW